MTTILLESISTFDNPSLSNIIISDDGTTEETHSKLTTLKDTYKNIFNITTLFNPIYHSFAKTVNVGMKESTLTNPKNDVLLLNNDMIAHTTFEPFVNFINNNNINNNINNSKVGIIGGKLLYENGNIQSVGTVCMKFTKRFRHNYKYKSHNYPPSNIPKKYIAITGACLYINNELINKIGYFDENYILSFEDTDYCLNAQFNGYEVWYIPSVVMTHYESTTRTDPYFEQNRALFWKKWNDTYESIRMNQEILNDDLDVKVIASSSLAGYYLMFG